MERRSRKELKLESLEPRTLMAVLCPDPDAHGPYSSNEGSGVILEATGSHPLYDVLAVEWDLDNNGTYETDAGSALGNYNVSWDALQALDLPSNGTGAEIGLHVQYKGKLTVIIYNKYDDAFLAINNVNPSADAGGDYAMDEGQPLYLDASASTDPDANDVLNYQWDLNGDSVYDFDSGSNPVPAVPWSILKDLNPTGLGNDTPITIGLRVTDLDGGESADTALLRVKNLAPVVVAGGVYAVKEGQSLTLDGSASDPNANDMQVSYKWDLDNDGNFNGALDQAGQSITLSWSDLNALGLTNDGDFATVKLAVEDNDGGVGVDSAMILVTGNSAPEITDIKVGPGDNNYWINEGENLHLRASAVDAGSDKLRFLWDLDNDKVYDDAAGSDVVVPWSDLEALGYNNLFERIGLMVIDDGGDFDYAGTKVFVCNVLPKADAGGFFGKYGIDEGEDLVLDGSKSHDKNANDLLTYHWKVEVNGDTHYWYGGQDPVATIPWWVLKSWGVKGQGMSDPIDVKLTVSDDVWFGKPDYAHAYVCNVAPTADAGGPYVINEGHNLQLNGLGSSDPNCNDTLTYDWDLNDDGTYDILNQAEPLVTWATLHDDFGLASDGTSLVLRLRVSDGDGGEDVDRAFLLVVNNLAPSVNAGGPYEIQEGQNLKLNGTASDPGGDPLTYLWDLDNDGAFDDASTLNPTVPWNHLKLLNLNTNGGINTIAMLACDQEERGVGIDTANLIIQNTPPTANAGDDITINEGEQALLVGSYSDPYGDLDSPFHFAWNFGDGSTGSNAEHAAHTYVDNGVFNVIYSVTDKDGGTGTDALTVTVLNVAPTVDAGEDKVAVEGHLVAFSGKFTDPGKNDTHTVLWNFGDGSTADTLNALHTYADDGVYTATLTVTDDDGGVGVDTLTIYVQNAVPTVYAGQDAGIMEGGSIHFVGQFSDVAPDTTPAPTFLWEFGDGTTANTLTATHTYPQDGVYVARFTVTDKDGGVTFDEATIIVSNVPPTVNAGLDRLVNMDALVQFNGSFTDPGVQDTHTYLWDFGDGFTADTLNASHTYVKSGIYTATLTVTDEDFVQMTDTVQVTVQELLAISSNKAFLHATTGLLTVKLVGPGQLVQVSHIDGTGIDFNSIVLEGTTEASSLVITTRGVPKSFANLGDVVVNSSLGSLKANTTNLKGDVQILTGGLGTAKLMSIQENGTITTGLGGIKKINVKNDIEGDILSATSIGQVVSRKGGLAETATVVANAGDIGKAKFASDVDGMILAQEDVLNVSSAKGMLSGTIRAGGEIGKVQFSQIDSATISAFGDVASVKSKGSMVDSLLLAGYDLGADGLPGTGDELFNASGATIGAVAVNPLGSFTGTYAMAGVKPYDFDADTRIMLAPVPAAQVLASYGAIGTAKVGQVINTGSPEVGVYGLFAATESIENVKFTPITASGAPLFEARSQWF